MPPFTPQQLVAMPVMMDRKVLVAKLGLSRSCSSISLPFSRVVTEHMALRHMRTRAPPATTSLVIRIANHLCIYLKVLTCEGVHVRHPAEDRQRVVLFRSHVSYVGCLVTLLSSQIRKTSNKKNAVKKKSFTSHEEWKKRQ